MKIQLNYKFPNLNISRIKIQHTGLNRGVRMLVVPDNVCKRPHKRYKHFPVVVNELTCPCRLPGVLDGPRVPVWDPAGITDFGAQMEPSEGARGVGI